MSVTRRRPPFWVSGLDAIVLNYRYPTPLILHSKHFTIDDDVAVVGSSNIDNVMRLTSALQ